MFYLWDKSQNLVSVIPRNLVREATMIEELKTASLLDVLLDQKVELSNAYYIAHKDIVNVNTIKIYKIIDTTWKGQSIAVQGIEMAYDELLAYGYIKDQRPNEKPLREVVTNILAGSRWNTGTIEVSPPVTENFYYVTRLEALNRAAAVGNVEWTPRIAFDGKSITGRFIDIKKQIGEDRGKRYVHGSNLIEVIKQDTRGHIYTAIVGRGKGELAVDDEGVPTGGYGRKITFENVIWDTRNDDPVNKPAGQEWVEKPELTDLYGFSDGSPRIGFVEFNDCEDSDELLQLTYDYLISQGRPKVTYRSYVRDAGDTGLGDTVTIIRDDLDIRYKTRIYKRKINLLIPEQAEIELGDKITSYSAEQVLKLEAKIEERDEALTANTQELVNYIKNYQFDAYWGEDGYNYNLKIDNEYGLPAGFYSFDTPIDGNPTKFIYVGAGKIVISNEKNPDGTWKLKTILDGDGLGTGIVAADQIVAGAITTDHVSADGINANKITVGDETLDQTLVEIGNENVTIEQHLTQGGNNLLLNPTWGGARAPDETYWYSWFAMGLFFARMDGHAMDDIPTIIGTPSTMGRIFGYMW
jgi:phage minor structural protein